MDEPLPLVGFSMLPFVATALDSQFIRIALFVRAPHICGYVSDDCAQALDVAGNNGKGDITFEAVNSMIPAQILTVNTKSVDRRFNGRVLLSCLNKFRSRLPLFIFKYNYCNPASSCGISSRDLGSSFILAISSSPSFSCE